MLKYYLYLISLCNSPNITTFSFQEWVSEKCKLSDQDLMAKYNFLVCEPEREPLCPSPQESKGK